MDEWMNSLRRLQSLPCSLELNYFLWALFSVTLSQVHNC